VIAKQSDDVYGTNTLGYQYEYSPAQAAYDDQVIQTYIKTTGINFIKAPSINIPGTSYYYAVRVPGAGTDSITQNSDVTITYEGRLLNNTVFDQAYNAIADTINVAVPSLPKGVQEALTHVAGDATISVVMPSALGYGDITESGIPILSCLRYEYEIKRVYP